MEGASGRDFIAGVAAGYEVMERMAADWIPTVMARGFHAGPVFSIFGAAVAAAKIMRFTDDQVHAAISLCTNLAGSNLESRALREGAAVRNAMLAVSLAKQGTVGGGEEVLEGPAGFYHAYAGDRTGHLTYSFVGATKASLDALTATSARDGVARDALRIYRFPATTCPHRRHAKLCEEQTSNRGRRARGGRRELAGNEYPSPAFRCGENTRRAAPGSTRYYTAYGVVKRGFRMLPVVADPPEVLELMKRVQISVARVTLFGPRIRSLRGTAELHEAGDRPRFIWNFDEERAAFAASFWHPDSGASSNASSPRPRPRSTGPRRPLVS